MDLILEIKSGGDVVRLQTRPGGDVEILTCRTEQERYVRHALIPGGVYDSCVGITPNPNAQKWRNFW